MREQAYIILTSEHPDVFANVAYKREEIQKSDIILDQNDFAILLKNFRNSFKTKHCRSKNCFIYVSVHNKGKTDS